MSVKPIITVMLVLFGTLTMSSDVFAQGGGKPDKEQMEAMKIAYLTTELDLTSEEAQVFWPVYNAKEAELDALRKERRANLRDAKQNRDTWSDEQILAFLDREINFKEREVQIITNYHGELKKVLPAKKLAILYHAEDGFKRKLLKSMREGRPGGGPGGGPRGGR